MAGCVGFSGRSRLNLAALPVGATGRLLPVVASRLAPKTLFELPRPHRLAKRRVRIAVPGYDRAVPASRPTRKKLRLAHVLSEAPLEELPPLRRDIVSEPARGKPNDRDRAGGAHPPSRDIGFPNEIDATDLGGGFTGHRLAEPHTYRCAICGSDRTGRQLFSREPFHLAVCPSCYSRETRG